MLKMGAKVAIEEKAPVQPLPGIIEQPKKEYEKKKSTFTLSSGAETAADIMAALQKTKGSHVVTFANLIPPVRRLATGMFEFDFHTCGGFPFNRYSIIYGPESSGKTNLCLKAVAAAQRLPGPNNVAVWVNLEQSFDPLWAIQMGVDIDKLLVVNASYGEEAVDVIDGLLRASDVAILVVDSIASLTANKEIGQSTETAEVGLSPILVKRLVNKMMCAFAEKKRLNQEIVVILINQIRFKIGVMFGNPESMPGGEAQKFLCSLRIRLQATNEIVKSVNPNLHVFKDTKAKIIKSKVPVLKNEFSYKQCVVAHEELQVGDTRSWGLVQTYLKQLNLLVKSPKQGWRLDGVDYPTLTAIQDKYDESESFKLKLQGLVINAFHGQASLVDDPEESQVPDVPAGKMVFADKVAQ